MNLLNSKGVSLLALITLASTGASGSEGDVDYRHYAMEAVGVPHSEHLSLHANAIADMARIAPVLFPEGSQGREALPAIWEQPKDFAERLDEFHSAAEAFKNAAASGDPAMIGSAIGALGQSCKDCHDSYREE